MLDSSLKLNGVGTYLDHPNGAILPWAKRVPALVYPAILAAQATKDIYQSKTPKERNDRLKDHAIRMGIPMLATIAATAVFMKPDAESYNTPTVAVEYFRNQGRDPFVQGQGYARQAYAPLKALKLPIWGKLNPDAKLAHQSSLSVFQTIEAGDKPLDIQVGGVIRAVREHHEAGLKAVLGGSNELQQAFANQQFYALEFLGDVSKHDSIPQDELADRIADDVAHFKSYLASDAPMRSKLRKLTNTVMRHEIRLALPTNEDLGDFAGAFEGTRFRLDKFGQAMKRTAGEFFHEAAVPFLLVGGASVGSGVAAGFIANQLEGTSEKKNGDVVKEGIFQYVANIAMCGFGAGVGLAVANSLGFTKFRNPAARFGTIVAGLGAGIFTGAKLANPLSNKIETMINHHREKKGKPVQESSGRYLELADTVLHVDDIPTAFSVAGVQALKPWISPFFLMSGIKTAFGYRNVSPLVHLSPLPGDDTPTNQTAPRHINKLVEQDAPLGVDYRHLREKIMTPSRLGKPAASHDSYQFH